MQRWRIVFGSCVVGVLCLVGPGRGDPAFALLTHPQLAQVSAGPSLFAALHPPSRPVHPASATRQAAPPSLPGLTIPDAWSAPIRLRTPDGWFAAPIHATLMPDGQVVFIGWEFPTEGASPLQADRNGILTIRPSRADAPTPTQITGVSVSEPRDYAGGWRDNWWVSDTLVCAGQTLTSDGKLFTAGGTRFAINNVTGQQYLLGTPYATRFDGNRSWTRVPADMQATAGLGQPLRWYPTTTRLPDSRILVVGGFDVVRPQYLANAGAEIFNPAAGSWQVVAPSASTPNDVVSELYTHTFVLPSPRGDKSILTFGDTGVPVFLNPDGFASWEVSAHPRPGSAAFQQARQTHRLDWLDGLVPNRGASSAMLPIRLRDGEWGYHNGSVLLAGGLNGTTNMQHVDVYDPTSDTWRPRLDARLGRMHPVTVLLPDSRVLIVAGDSVDEEIRQAQYVDPRNGFALATGSSTGGVVRAYHNVAILLPDGRVLVGGGQTGLGVDNSEQTNLQYYSPPYMFADRPQITSAPTSISLGTSFAVEARGNRAPAEAVLIGLGAMTHSIDMNQRAVQIELSTVQPTGKGTYALSLRGPNSAQIASPGYYMLFVLDDQQIPSEAKIVQLTNPNVGQTLQPRPAMVHR